MQSTLVSSFSRMTQKYKNSESLQNDLDSLDDWSERWLLRFNPDKCHVLTLGKFENIMHTHRYKIYGTEIEHVFDEKDLGITVDSKLKFEEHISLKSRKANATMGMNTVKQFYFPRLQSIQETVRCLRSTTPGIPTSSSVSSFSEVHQYVGRSSSSGDQTGKWIGGFKILKETKKS